MKKLSLKINIVLNIIYTMSNIIFPLITFPYVSRILSAEGMGKVSFFTSLSNFLIMLASLGISTYGIRATAKVRDDKNKLSKVVVELLSINLISTMIIVIGIIGSIPFVEKFKTEPILLWINILLIASSFLGLNWLFSGLEQYDYITKRTIAVKLVSLILIFCFVKKKEDYSVYAAIIAGSSIVSYIINFIYAIKYLELHNVRKIDLKKHFKPMGMLFASILAVNIYTNSDVIMLGFISTDFEVGLYTVATKAKWLLLNLINAISAVLLPRLSYYLNERNYKKFEEILKKSIAGILMISIPLAIFFIMEAENCILILGGESYILAVKCMRIIMPILIISSFSNILGNQILIPLGKDECFMKAVIGGASINIICNMFLMPKYGCIGAAIATLLAEFVQMLIQFGYAKVYIIPNIKWGTLSKISVACIFSAITLFILNNVIKFNLIMEIVIDGIVFVGMYLMCLLWLKDEVVTYFFSNIFKKRKDMNK